jgi:quinol monooxygenase YgiN
MLIIAGHVIVAAADRDAYVTAHHDLVERGRKAAGCLDLAISADPLDRRRVNNFERWESQQALDAWRAVANAPDTGIAFEGADVQLFTVSDAREPFG